jgi:HEAT repeat protein
LVPAAVLLAGLAWGGSLWWEHRRVASVLELLRSSDANLRKTGAMFVAEEKIPAGLELIEQRLAQHAEPDANTRESFVYTLGRHAQPAAFDTIAEMVRTDPDPYVRQAAWLAAVRLDPPRFRQLAADVPPRDERWDRIGLACAWLEAGDVRGVNELLSAAESGDETQRRVASLALLRGVAPLLDTVGRWPLQFVMHEGQLWPPELVALVRERCAGLDLAAILADTRPHLARTAAVRRNVARLTTSRERIARFLELL